MANETRADHHATKTQSSFADVFTPKLVTAFRDGYALSDFRADVAAGLTVAIVALPLSMAIAIASGTTPDRGLYAAIFGGFIVSLLGGSRFQIGGPAGAFIVLVAASMTRHGIDGVLLATMIAGVILIAIGLLRLGSTIRYIPHAVTIGFTAGIAVIIFASQLRDLFGISLPSQEPGELLPKLIELVRAADTINPAAIILSLTTIAIILGVRKVRPAWPGMLIAVAATATLAAILSLPVDTIGTRFGGIPQTIPMPSWPTITFDKLIAVLPDALAFALLGSIESLLSAVVADNMSGRHHRSNIELVAQGAANIGSALFGGICVTGTIARTATNFRAGAHSPVAGMLHSVFLLLFMLLAGGLASYIPLATLAGVLVVVAWNMAEKNEFGRLLRTSVGEAAVLLATFLLTIFIGLTEAIAVGCLLAALLFVIRKRNGRTV